MNTDTKHKLETIKWGVIPVANYRGCLVEKIIGGYKILDKKVRLPDEVDLVIDEAGEKLADSILK